MKRLILTGERNRGKTRFCRLLAAEALSRGLTVAGILSLKEMKDARVIALWASDCREGEKRKLARFIPGKERLSAEPQDSKGSITPSWSFYPETFLWGNALITEAPPADLFILDEAGPLELNPGTAFPEEDRAWIAGLKRMDAGIDDTAIIVVRPELTDRARIRWPDAELRQAPDCGEGIPEIQKVIAGLLTG